MSDGPIYSILTSKPDPTACGYETWECKSLAAMGFGDSGYVPIRTEQNLSGCSSCTNGYFVPEAQGVPCDYETGPAGTINYVNFYCNE
jgi:hypothetical protein